MVSVDLVFWKVYVTLDMEMVIVALLRRVLGQYRRWFLEVNTAIGIWYYGWCGCHGSSDVCGQVKMVLEVFWTWAVLRVFMVVW